MRKNKEISEMNSDELAKAEMLRLEKTLTERQRKFVEELEKDGNASAAALRAGYSASSAAAQASRMLKNDKVLAYRRARATFLYFSQGVSGEWIGLQLLEIYRRCMAGEEHMSWDSEIHAWTPDGLWMFDAKNAVNALEKLGKSIGMFVEKRDRDGVTEIKFVIEGGGPECAE